MNIKKWFALLLFLLSAVELAAQEPPIRITQKRRELVFGNIVVPVQARADVNRVELYVNGIKTSEASGRSLAFTIQVGKFLRRIRVRAAGYDAANQLLGEDEVVINDPQPPFRVRLTGTNPFPVSGTAELTASLSAPPDVTIESVEFFMGDQSLGRDDTPPFHVTIDAGSFPDPLFATVTARTAGSDEAHDVFFWGSQPRGNVDVRLQQIPVSVAGPALTAPLTAGDLTLLDDREVRTIEQLIPAAEQPLNVILLMDASESMLSELPVLKVAAKGFARRLMTPRDRLAVVAFHQRTFWLTGFTSNLAQIDQAVDRIRTMGQTHLYDAGIEMLFELQKQPGRHALVILTDGVNQGGNFTLDHLVHYARYAGVPIYPIIKNRMLSRFRKVGIGGFQAKKFAGIARDTGATWFIIERPAQLDDVYRKIAEDLRQQYLLLFYTPPEAGDRWHNLAVSTRRKGVTLRAPRGYFP